MRLKITNITQQLKHLYQIKINKIMSYKLNTQDENPLWRNYMDNVNNDEQWMKEVKLNTPFPSKSFGTYSEDEFLEKLKSDEEFNKKWGTIKAPLSN